MFYPIIYRKTTGEIVKFVHMKKSWLSVILALLFFAQMHDLSAQKCITTEKSEQSLQEHPELQSIRKQLLLDQANKTSNYMITDVSYTIPVVVHILYNSPEQNISNEQVYSQIEILNQDYQRLNPDTGNTPDRFKDRAADIGFEFCLAEYDPEGNLTTGITRTATTIEEIGSTEKYYYDSEGGKTIWNPKQYLNIWVCEIGNDILGFTYLPGTTIDANDGVVIDYRNFGTSGTASSPYDGGRTTTHEVGHWFNLQHPWGNQQSCNVDDGVDDTPLQLGPNSGCPQIFRTSCNNSEDGGDIFMNYMDYTVDACQNLFTQGQKERMLDIIENYRNDLLYSSGCVTDSSYLSSTLQFNAYPNPTSGSTTIRIRLTELSDIKIHIFNLSGQLVKSWEMENYASGNIEFDVSEIGSGVFIIQLEHGSHAEHFKLVSIANQ